MSDMELGGNITLAGFKDEISSAELVVVKKMVGSYARKLADNLADFQSLKVTLKPVHKTENSEKYELHAKVHFNGDHFESSLVDRNLFMTLDEVLGRVTDHALKEEEKMSEK